MAREDLLARISIQPTTAELLQEYPQLKEEDIRSCLLYGAQTARGR